jgi:hypothetical protein
VRIVAIALLSIAAAGTLPGAGAARGEVWPPVERPNSRVLLYGPVLAGRAVVWLERRGGEAVLERAVPGRRPDVLLRQALRNASLDDLAASRAVVALERHTMVCPPPTPPVAYSCTDQREVLGGAPSGRLRVLSASDDCGGGSINVSPSVDVSGDLVVLGENVCVSPGNRRRLVVVVRPDRPGRSVLCEAEVPQGPPRCRGDARIAGRFVAWSEGQDAVVVYDRLRRRVAYRPLLPRVQSFDLEADGRLAAAYYSQGLEGGASVAWRTRQAGGVLPFRAKISDRSRAVVRIARDRILVERVLSPTASALVLSDLRGRTKRLARFASPVRREGDFDFDGGRVTWASTRITSTKLECPPPGIGAPCVRTASGVTTVWLENAAGGTRRAVARLAFGDVSQY